MCDTWNDHESPVERDPHLFGLIFCGLKKGFAACEAVGALSHCLFCFPELGMFCVGILIAEHDNDRESKNFSESFVAHLHASEAVRKIDIVLRHGVPAGVSEDRSCDSRLIHQKEHSVSKLGTGGMSEHQIA